MRCTLFYGLSCAENGMKRAMIDKLTGVASEAKPSRRMARRIFEAEAYRRIIAGKAPETLSEFAAQLSHLSYGARAADQLRRGGNSRYVAPSP